MTVDSFCIDDRPQERFGRRASDRRELDRYHERVNRKEKISELMESFSKLSNLGSP